MKKVKEFFSALKAKLSSTEKKEKKSDSTESTGGTKHFKRKAILWIVVIGAIVAAILFFFAEPITSKEIVLVNGEEQNVETVVFSWIKLWSYAVIIYIIASYRFWAPVPTGQQAALAYFGKPIANVEAGPPYAPPFVISVLVVTAQTPQREFPAEPELIDRTELKDGYIIPPNKKPPLRIQFRNSISEKQARKLFGDDFVAKSATGEEIEFVAEVPVESDSVAEKAADGLSRRVTAEVQHVARIRVEDPCAFFTNVPSGNTGDPIDEAFRQIEDESVKILTQYFTRMSVAQALMNIRWISIHLQNAVDLRVGAKGDRRSWGVDVQAAFVKLIHTDHGINIAISEAAQSPFKKSKTIITAEGERQKRELEGKGDAVAARELEQRKLEGRAKGLKKLAHEIQVTGSEAQAAEVARVIGESGNTVVLGGEGFGQLGGLVAATLGNNKKAPKEKTEPSTSEGSDEQKSD